MLLRSTINKARRKSKQFLAKQQRHGCNSKLYKSSKFILRTNNFSINYYRAFRCLDNIDFIYDNIHKHWAETDGIGIWLNTYKNYTDKLLTNTLILEALHGIVYRDNRHPIPEKKEHQIMELINLELVTT
jgi:hypothetical protein